MNPVTKTLSTLLTVLEQSKWNIHYQAYRETYNIHPSFRFNGAGILFYGSGEIKIGAGSYIGRYSSIQTSLGTSVTIGINTAISHYVMIYTENKNPRNFKETMKGNVSIGDNCWIGAGVFIKEGVSIGNNVVVGAHSFVNSDVPDGVIVAGTPARITSPYANSRTKMPKNSP